MAARSPARWNAQRLARHLAKCFAGANRVANFVALDVALRVANQPANVRAFNFSTPRGIAFPLYGSLRVVKVVSPCCPSTSTLTMLASPKTGWRLRFHAGSVTVIDRNTSESNRQSAGLDKCAASRVSGGHDFGAFFDFRKASSSAFSSGLIIFTLAMCGPRDV